MITQNTQGFWTRKWALQPVRLCCRGKPKGIQKGILFK